MKEDQPMELPAHGEATVRTLRMGSNYSTQFYFDLENSKIVHSGNVDSWHLSFENTGVGEAIFLNGGVGMALVATDKSDFEEVGSSDHEGHQWVQDNPNGKHEESAIGNWNQNSLTRDRIYLIRLNESNEFVYAIKFKSVSSTAYHFEFKQLGTNNTTDCAIEKDPTRTYSYFNLKSQKTVADVEPIKESWDLVFTRYGFTFHDQTPPLPYIVTGVLTQPETEVYKDSLHDFYEIDEEILSKCDLQTNRDIIGFDWKYYDFDLGIYHIRQDYTYIIKTKNEQYFKLRFLSFYDDNGLKGTPTFEYRRIK